MSTLKCFQRVSGPKAIVIPFNDLETYHTKIVKRNDKKERVYSKCRAQGTLP